MQIINKKMKPLFKMAKIARKDIPFPFPCEIEIGLRLTEHKGGIIIFPPDNSRTPSTSWSSLSVPDLKITGKPRSAKDMKLIIDFAKKYEYEIIEIGQGRLDVKIFHKFLKILSNDEILDDFRILHKDETLLSVDIMIDEWESYIHTKTTLAVACLDKKLNFIGVIGVRNPDDAVFIDEKYMYLKYELAPWIKKYRNYIIKIADRKMEFMELSNKVIYDIRYQT